MIPQWKIFVGEAMEATEVAGPGEQGQVLAAASPGDAVGFGKPGARRRRGAGGEDGGKNSEELVDLNLIWLNNFKYIYIYVYVYMQFRAGINLINDDLYDPGHVCQ